MVLTLCAAAAQVFLLGDSHALNLIPSLAAAVHGEALLRPLIATGRGFLSPFADGRLDAYQASQVPRASASRLLRPSFEPPSADPDLARSPPTSPDLPQSPSQGCGETRGMTKHYREAVLAVLRSDMQKGDVLVVHNKWAVSSLSMSAPHHATHTPCGSL